MKIRTVDTSQTIRKVTKPKKRPRKSRAAKTRSNKKRRRRLRAALTRHPRSSKLIETLSLPESSIEAPSVIHHRLSGMSGNWYWLNYSNVFHWKDHHLSNNGVTAYSLPGQNLWPSERPDPSQDSAEGCASGGLLSTAGSYKPFDPSAAPEVDLTHEDLDGDGVVSDAESDEDIVVTKEMMQFLEISMRHKASLGEKKEEAKKQEGKILKAERDAIEDCLAPSGEADNEKRHAEMASLYGEKAPMIHGMETALQLTFNRQVDLFSPPYWPIHPFTIQFKS